MRNGGKKMIVVVLISSDTITWLKYYYTTEKERIKNKVWIIIKVLFGIRREKKFIQTEKHEPEGAALRLHHTKKNANRG